MIKVDELTFPTLIGKYVKNFRCENIAQYFGDFQNLLNLFRVQDLYVLLENQTPTGLVILSFCR